MRIKTRARLRMSKKIITFAAAKLESIIKLKIYGI